MAKSENETVRSNSMMVWSTFIIAIVALIVSLLAFNRTARIDKQSNLVNLQKEVQTIREEQVIEQAQDRLTEIREQINNTGNFDDAQKGVAQVRRDVRQSFTNATEATKETWNDLDKELEQIEQQLRDGSADALNSLDNFITKLKNEIRTDERR